MSLFEHEGKGREGKLIKFPRKNPVGSEESGDSLGNKDIAQKSAGENIIDFGTRGKAAVNSIRGARIEKIPMTERRVLSFARQISERLDEVDRTARNVLTPIILLGSMGGASSPNDIKMAYQDAVEKSPYLWACRHATGLTSEDIRSALELYHNKPLKLSDTLALAYAREYIRRFDPKSTLPEVI